ncbi:acetolactate synthase small subunit [Methanonatronarchaeum sp. AMET6-2]|uniref:acetolactate synthase small subunit n=1 Tax=Methanonatronarchaeum sp. AMET6-2 TaxID=2933293 RepID=UPI001200D241|nr:acetolactate synthase small subunit [Methanonatronarchaeum sp. AMET6-2]RZN60843.1 MAG: acetolactate synthase small subunit [Methanonatronarchaeia archaeon]UOY09540.1 acetolactate synthase small subunit [Methanonatronarchaeum sp. AMET6-2]
MKADLHVIGLLVENKPGVLNRVANLFSRRGYNIETISVGVTENPEISRMTITLKGDEDVLEQVIKQLNKQMDVIKVTELKEDYVERGLALIKVNADGPDSRSEIIQIADIFRANVVDVGKKALTIEVTGDQKKIDAIINMLKEHGIKEIAQTGTVAMNRGRKSIGG